MGMISSAPKTTEFMVGSAVLMLGPCANIHDFQPATHGVGMLKNFKLSTDAKMIELTYGVTNQLAHSIKSGSKLSFGADLFEYTQNNIQFANGFNGLTNVVTGTKDTLDATVAAGATTFVIPSDVTAKYPSGSIVRLTAAEGKTHLAKTSGTPSLTGGKTTVTFAPATPTGTSFTVAETSVEKVVSVSMGSASDNVYLAAVISGSNANGEIITLHFPKVKLTSGFELSFTETDYKPLPVQFDAYPMVSTDTLYADALYNGSNPRDPGFLFRTGYAA